VALLLFLRRAAALLGRPVLRNKATSTAYLLGVLVLGLLVLIPLSIAFLDAGGCYVALAWLFVVPTGVIILFTRYLNLLAHARWVFAEAQGGPPDRHDSDRIR
jgi:hypothetical protein